MPCRFPIAGPTTRRLVVLSSLAWVLGGCLGGPRPAEAWPWAARTAPADAPAAAVPAVPAGDAEQAAPPPVVSADAARVPRPGPVPRVLLECVGDGAEGSGPEADALLRGAVEQALLRAGLEAVDGPRLETVRGVDGARFDDDPARALALRTRFGVEAIMRVEYSLRYLYTRAIYGVQYDFFQPAVLVRVIAADTGQLVDVHAASGQATASVSALATLGGRLAATAADRLVTTWRRPPSPAGARLLVVLGGVDAALAEGCVARLRGMSEVARADLRSLVAETAEIEVDLALDTPAFLQALERWRRPAVLIDGHGSRRVDLRATAEPPPPLLDLGPTLLEADGRWWVTGRVAEAGARVRVNGQDVELDADGRFRVAVPAGAGSIRVRATDAHGNTVEREVRP